MTATNSGLDQTVTQTLKDLVNGSYVQSNSVTYSLFSLPTQNPISILNKYAGKNTNKVQYFAIPNMPITKLGRLVSHVVNPASLNEDLRAFSAKIFQVLLLIGIVILYFKQRNKSSKKETYFYSLVMSSLILLILMTLLPQISEDYGATRLFQQTLIIIALPIALAAGFLLSIFKKYKVYILAVFFALLFLDLSGLIPQLLGGYPAQLSLNNEGAYFESYYVSSYDNNAGIWIIKNVPKQDTVAMDSFAITRFTQYGYLQFKAVSIVNYTNTKYIYQDYANIKFGAYQIGTNGDIIRFILKSDPAMQYDVVYYNGGSRVLK